MISEKDKSIILEYAQKYNLNKIILFGSTLEKEDANDIDIAIKGIKPELFFKFYGELLFAISQPIDVINLDKNNSFTNLVEREGIKLYG